jgi:hypothetical protein
MEVAMPRVDTAVIVQNELLEGPEGASIKPDRPS